ncbi:MAG: acetolactate synthase small subunit [Candidatus Micrarchaeia archaeon]
MAGNAKGNGTPHEHILSLLVEDKFGVLQRISGVFSRRGFNMNTITVGKTEKPGLSRMTITTTGDDHTVEQIIKQLSKLVETIKVIEMEPEKAVTREIALAKIHVKDFAARNELMNFTSIFRGRVIDVGANSMIVEVTGPADKIDAFVELIRPFGIKEMVRTGITALSRD